MQAKDWKTREHCEEQKPSPFNTPRNNKAFYPQPSPSPPPNHLSKYCYTTAYVHARAWDFLNIMKL